MRDNTHQDVNEKLKAIGIHGRGKIKIVAGKTGYSEGMVSRLLSGKVELSDRFLSILESNVFSNKSDNIYHPKEIHLSGWYTQDDLIKILYELTTQTPA